MNVAKNEAKVLEAISLADNAGFEGTASALRELLPDFDAAVFERQSARDIPVAIAAESAPKTSGL